MNTNSIKNNSDLSNGEKGSINRTTSVTKITDSKVILSKTTSETENTDSEITIIKRNPQYTSFKNTVEVMGGVVLILLAIGFVGGFTETIIGGILGGILLVASFYNEPEMKNDGTVDTKMV